MSQERLRILEMLQAGDITSEQAMALIDALDETGAGDETTLEGVPESAPVDISFHRSWWVFPTAAGSVVMAMGAPLVALGLTGRAALFWAVCCGWLPFMVGLLVLTLGVWSRNARWFHLRIRNNQTGRQSLALSLPLPLTLTARLLRFAQPYVPQLKDTGIDDAILALQESARHSEGQPLYIDVQDDEDGEQVLIWFG
jgi:hypothetical protein